MYDILVSAGDYDPNYQLGPTFKFEDVGVIWSRFRYSLFRKWNQGRNECSYCGRGWNFDTNSCLFFLT